MSKNDLKTILFAGLVCVVCSLLLSTAASTLKERQVTNQENDRKLNVLKAFGVDIFYEDGSKLTSDDIKTYFTDHISEIFLSKETGEVLEGTTSVPKREIKAKTTAQKTILPLYVWKDDGQPTKYAFPISGMGLWSILYGYIALDRDLATVIGVTFYKHGETPGLGGECSSDWFQAQFKGKKVWENGDLLQFEVVKGKATDKYPDGNNHAVDGMSGATMTGNGINKFLNRDLKLYDKYFSKKRGI